MKACDGKNQSLPPSLPAEVVVDDCGTESMVDMTGTRAKDLVAFFDGRPLSLENATRTNILPLPICQTFLNFLGIIKRHHCSKNE